VDAVSYRFDCEGVNWSDLEGLFAIADLGGRAGDKIRRAFGQSSHVCFAYQGSRLVGASRALTDGEYHALIYDVVVHPDCQRQGIGSAMMDALLARLPVWRVMLVADHDVQPFYSQFGFTPYSDVLARLDWERLYDPA
jgi:ribosomal protein S18 acetylase RimI-like enzyme